MTPKPSLATERGAFFNVDCLKLFEALPSDSIDTVFADPPFNIGKEYKNGRSDDLEDERYLKWCREWLDQSVRVLRPGGAVFIYILPRWGYHFAAHLERRKMQFRHWIALTMKGTFPRGNKLYPAHYAILYFTKGNPKTFNKIRLPIPACRHCGGDIKDYGGHRKYLNPQGLNLTDFWEDTSPARHGRNKSRWHINELRPMVPERCIAVSTNEDDLILDPFGGGGSTYIVAERLRRYWLGSEIGPKEPIIERFAREFSDLEPRSVPPENLEALLRWSAKPAALAAHA